MTLETRQKMHVRYFLNQKGDIHRATLPAPSGYGGRTDTLTQVSRQVPCKASRPTRPQVIEEGKRPAALGEWEVSLPVGTQIGHADTITIGADKYEVLGTNKGQVEALCLTCYCTKVSK